MIKKIVLLIVIIATLSACKNENTNPDRFKKGTFEIPEGKGYAKTKIIRHDSIQIEKYENRIDTLVISWKNNFNYTLKMLHPKTAIDAEPIHIKITAIESDSYDFEAVIGQSNYIQEGTITKISD